MRAGTFAAGEAGCGEGEVGLLSVVDLFDGKGNGERAVSRSRYSFWGDLIFLSLSEGGRVWSLRLLWRRMEGEGRVHLEQREKNKWYKACLCDRRAGQEEDDEQSKG